MLTSLSGPGRSAAAALRALALLSLAAGCGGSGAPETPPNLILVTLDTTRADCFGVYGDERGLTPSFDALAADGVVFDLAISTAGLTPVSHASILTGLNPYAHRLRVLSAEGGYRLPADVPTLATALQQRGYATAAVHSAIPVSAHFGFDRGFDVFRSFEIEGERQADELERSQRRSDETTDIVLETLDSLPRPFFLWIHYWDPHDGRKLPPQDFQDHYRAGQGLSGGWTKEDRYALEVSYVDHEFGRLKQALEADGTYAETVFVVTADHGQGLGDHGWPAHRLVYQEQIHVPLILRLPGGPRGRRVEAMVRTIDIAPTVAAALDVPFPEVEGSSLLDLLDGAQEPPRMAYADAINGYDEHAGMARRPKDQFLYMVTDGEWKLIYRPDHFDDSELFHLGRDHKELDNRWSAEPEPRKRLLLELARLNGWVTHPFQADEGTQDDAERRALVGEQLEALGYAGGEGLDAPAEDHWAWTCVDHLDDQLERRGACPRCGLPLILVARRT